MTHTNDSKKRRFQKVVDILDRVGIPDPEKRYFSYPHELSGGMCQRVMIAMAICLKPKLLIADEPTTALDVTIQAQILNLLKDLQKDEGMALILISHDIGVIQYMCEEILVMYAGEVVEKSNSQDLLKAPKHPYTEKLLKSLPKYHGIKKELLDTIPGMVPELSNRPQGCQFAERCAYKTTECGKVQELSEINHSLVRCHTPLNIGASS
jgi:dipeptide transport system ATP-binding protein